VKVNFRPAEEDSDYSDEEGIFPRNAFATQDPPVTDASTKAPTS